jgi:hypothetical protein
MPKNAFSAVPALALVKIALTRFYRRGIFSREKNAKFAEIAPPSALLMRLRCAVRKFLPRRLFAR